MVLHNPMGEMPEEEEAFLMGGRQINNLYSCFLNYASLTGLLCFIVPLSFTVRFML